MLCQTSICLLWWTLVLWLIQIIYLIYKCIAIRAQSFRTDFKLNWNFVMNLAHCSMTNEHPGIGSVNYNEHFFFFACCFLKEIHVLFHFLSKKFSYDCDHYGWNEEYYNTVCLHNYVLISILSQHSFWSFLQRFIQQHMASLVQRHFT